jgi:hypothetical protein
MASKSQESYMIAMSLVISAAQVIAVKYRKLSGREWIKGKTSELEVMAKEALEKAHGGFDKKDLGETYRANGVVFKIPGKLEKKLGKMEEAGLDKVDSCRAYLSMLIAITGDLLVEIPKTSKKYSDVEKLHSHIEGMWRYFSSRNQRDEFDADGMALGLVFSDEFKTDLLKT